MEAVRHIALGCCVLSTVAGMVRIFWPENGFAPVINAVLVLYIISAGLQMIRGTDWKRLTKELYAFSSSTTASQAEYAEYGRSVGLSASVEAVQRILSDARIESVATLEGNTCCVQLVHESDRTRAEAILESSGGQLPYKIVSGGDVP